MGISLKSCLEYLTKFFASIFSQLGFNANHINGGKELEISQISEQETEIINHLVNFRDLRVSEIMIPRADIIAVKANTEIAKLFDKFVETSFTRIPIYKSNLDEMLGFIHCKDMFKYMQNVLEHTSSEVVGSEDVKESKNSKTPDYSRITHKFMYATRSTKCADLLRKMRNEAKHMAVILDEYGGTEGIVTIEQLVEEILGDIKDEHENQQRIEIKFIKAIDQDQYVVDTRLPIEELEEALKMDGLLSEEEGEYETVSGFILAYLGRLPSKGEIFTHPVGIAIEIMETDPRKVKLVRIRVQKPGSGGDAKNWDKSSGNAFGDKDRE